MTARSIISKFIEKRHWRASRALGYALSLGDFDGWKAASLTWAISLTDTESAGLAYSSLKAVDPDHRDMVLHAALGGAGMPHAPFLSPMDQAAFWADLASGDELDAYCLACYKTMPRNRQAAFLEYVLGRQAA